MPRTPRNYDGQELTSHRFTDVLPRVLSRIADTHKDRPDLILASWPAVVGANLAPMTEAVSFSEGVLTVKVKSSSLYSVLIQQEGKKLLKELKMKFPNVTIRSIRFRMG